MTLEEFSKVATTLKGRKVVMGDLYHMVRAVVDDIECSVDSEPEYKGLGEITWKPTCIQMNIRLVALRQRGQKRPPKVLCENAKPWHIHLSVKDFLKAKVHYIEQTIEGLKKHRVFLQTELGDRLLLHDMARVEWSITNLEAKLKECEYRPDIRKRNRMAYRKSMEPVNT